MNLCRRAALHGLIAMLVAAALPQSQLAQIVRGTVTDSASRLPISGAVVTLLDAGDRVLDRNITDERGQYRISYRGTAKSLRVVRIGFQPRDLSLAAATAAERSLDITMAPFTTTLATVRITDKPGNCQRAFAHGYCFRLAESDHARAIRSASRFRRRILARGESTSTASSG